MADSCSKIHPAIADIKEAQWDALVQDDHPFMRYAFLRALEDNGCVGEEFGWLPRHIAIHDTEQHLIGALPLYEKYNNYGEFVFDHAWADAWHRAGIHYYPKLVATSPYTPASGQRLLCRRKDWQATAPILLETAVQFARQQQMSGIHFLFANASEQDWLEAQPNMLTRHDCQFHWHNQGYQSFDHFLQQLSSKKRKNIKQERKRVAQSGVRLRLLDGHTASTTDWQHFAAFYKHTFEEKWGTPTLNEGFFRQIGKTMPENIVLVLADLNGECIAGSLMFRSKQVLYGRHWGAVQHVDKLHFEACYYQGIEYCIAHGLHTFEPGAQGEHKIARGFVPTLTRSSHWMNENPFQTSLERYVEHEREAIADYIEHCWQKIPFRDKPGECPTPPISEAKQKP